jgi:rRNA maturation endonuclease Nob1
MGKAKGAERESQVRCLKCFTRFGPPARAERAACPACGMEWRISWLDPTFPKIRGPVWEKVKP